MKTHFFFLAVLLLLLASCSQVEQMEEQVIPSNVEVPASYNISLADINRIDFSRMITSQTKAASSLSKEITPIVEDADTLLYVINYGDAEGWVLAAADKRAPIIMAMGENGQFDLEMLNINKGVRVWLEGVKDKILYLKEHPEFVPDTSLLQVLQPGSIMTKGNGDEHDGEWLQLVYTIIDFGEVRYDIDHLTSTQWGQEDPWNLCLPYNSSPNDRCLAGCAIVAAAQQAYYLNSFIGKPAYAYQYGICTDYYTANNNNPQIDLYNSSSSTWSTMVESASDTSSVGKQAVSALMAEIIDKSVATWSDGEAVASLGMIRDYFTYYSISCSSSIFDEDLVLNDIINSKPVIVGLDSANGLFDNHTAVIDGAKVYAPKYTYYYQWMPIGTFPPVEPEFPDLDHPELYEITSTWGQNSSYYFRLNWGFDGLLDDYLYLVGIPWGMGSFTYEPDVILYNFH